MLERPEVNVWQSAEDGEKGIDEDEKEETVVASLACKLISHLARCRHLRQIPNTRDTVQEKISI